MCLNTCSYDYTIPVCITSVSTLPCCCRLYSKGCLGGIWLAVTGAKTSSMGDLRKLCFVTLLTGGIWDSEVLDNFLAVVGRDAETKIQLKYR